MITRICGLELTSAQKYLWERTQEEMEDHCYSDALFLAQCLLRSAPEFLEARKLTRKIAIMMYEGKSFTVFEKIKRFLRCNIVRGTVVLLIKRKRLEKALLSLEYFLATAPFEQSANLLMASVAKRWNPPLLPLALFALETALKINQEKIELHLEIARVALLLDENKTPWNPERAIMAYQQVLSLQPDHLEARQGLKNACAFLSMRNI
ncbi:MAG: hypothetical protein DVB29_04820 [Verrucomicrobia bacterium]|nr:MAG: hypothetical protein DVB29_04820 [Verrucomicrobiota bacterium]